MFIMICGWDDVNIDLQVVGEVMKNYKMWGSTVLCVIFLFGVVAQTYDKDKTDICRPMKLRRSPHWTVSLTCLI